jgi:membrane-bound inhibitor of C-type lysozyme
MENVMPLSRQRLSILAAFMLGLPNAAGAAPGASHPFIQVEKPAELVFVARNKRPRTEGVTAVVHARGEFRKVGPRKWIETGKRGVSFQFREVGDDGRMVTLFDRSRNIFVYINLRREMILWAPDGEEPRDLYPILGVIKDAPRDDDDFGEEPDVPKIAKFTCEEGIPMNVRFENRGERSLAFVSIDGSPEMRLKQIPAASGAKYSNGEYTVWTKGRNAVLEINGDSDICVGR